MLYAKLSPGRLRPTIFRSVLGIICVGAILIPTTQIKAEETSAPLPEVAAPAVNGSYTANGPAGGPFLPSSYSVSISNPTFLPWTYVATENFNGMSIDAPTSGTIPAFSSRIVRIRPNNAANSIPPGSFRTGLMTIQITKPTLPNETRTYALRINANKRAGDDFLSATTLSSITSISYNAQSNQYYSTEFQEPRHDPAATSQRRSRWFKWRAPSTGQMTAWTELTSWDPVMAIYASREDGLKSVSRLAQITTDNDSGVGTDPRVYFHAIANQTYYIAVASRTSTIGNYGTFRLRMGRPTGTASGLLASVLPASRSSSLNGTVTAFATIINTSGSSAFNCGIETVAQTSPYREFSFQTVTPANVPIGTVNRRVTIPNGGSQGFVFSIKPKNAYYGFQNLWFDCSNKAPVPINFNLNSMFLYAENPKPPDVIAAASTAPQPGVVRIPGNTGNAAFAVAAINNNGPSEAVRIRPVSVGGANVSLRVCRTNPGTGLCITPLATSINYPATNGAARTFTVFVTGTGFNAFAPATRRIFVNFERASNGRIVGRTSVAVRTN